MVAHPSASVVAESSAVRRLAVKTAASRRRARIEAKRLLRVVAGVSLVHLGFAVALRANLGTGPFNVLQQGVAARIGVSIGRGGWLNGSVFVLLALALAQRPGISTI